MKKEFDLMLCDDGVTRSVPIIDGVKVDPSKGKPKEIKKEEKPEKPKISIQDRITNQVYDFVSSIEGVIDDFIISNYKLKYDFYKQLTEAGCKSVHARKMRKIYLESYNELVDVYNKEDDYVQEAWSHLKPKTIQKMMDFYGMILDDIDRIIKNASAQRKPRKKKEVSTTKLKHLSIKKNHQSSSLLVSIQKKLLVLVSYGFLIPDIKLWVFIMHKIR